MKNASFKIALTVALAAGTIFAAHAHTTAPMPLIRLDPIVITSHAVPAQPQAPRAQ